MKAYIINKPFIVITLIFVFLFIFSERIYAQEHSYQEINADSYIVIDSKTGEIIIEKNMNKQQFPASITKIITAIIAIQERDINETVTISEHAQNTEGTSLSLIAGDRISLKDLLYGIMLHSGNDGAVAIAEHISNSEMEFAKKMTSFARSIGANNTQFTNASGLPNNNHYTTAYDMAIITRYAMKNNVFKEIVQHKQYTWDSHFWRNDLMEHEKIDASKLGIPWEGDPKIVNHNLLLDLYEGATGIKNGFTHEARYTLVGSAKKKGTELIAVLLKSKDSDTAYKDMTNLLDSGFKVIEENSNNLAVNQEDELLRNQGQLSNPEKETVKKQSNIKAMMNNFYTLPLTVLIVSLIILLIIKRKQNR